MSLSNWNINIGKKLSFKKLEFSSPIKEEKPSQFIDVNKEAREYVNSLTWYPKDFKTRKEEVSFWEEIIDHYKIEVSKELLQAFEYVKKYG